MTFIPRGFTTSLKMTPFKGLYKTEQLLYLGNYLFMKIQISMKKNFYFFLFLLLFFIPLPAIGGKSPAPPINLEDHPVMQAQVPLNRAQLETQLGRKLTFKERIGLSLLKSGITKDKKHQPVTDSSSRTNGFAVAGFVIGLVSLFVAGIPLGTVALVFSGIALGQIEERGEKGKGFAIAGLILGIIGVVGATIVLANM